MDSQEKSSFISQIIAMAVMITSSVLYIWAVPVSNQFEISRYFLYEALVPTLILSAIIGVLCRIFKHFIPAIAFGLMLASALLNFFVVLSFSSFISSNSANFMVVFGWMVIHNSTLYSYTFAMQMSATIVTAAWMAKVHQKYKEDGAVIVSRNSAALTLATAASAVMLLVSVKVGPVFIVLANLPLYCVGILAVAAVYIRRPGDRDKQPPDPASIGMGAGELTNEEFRRKFMGSRLVGTIMMILTLAVTSLFLPVHGVSLDFEEDFGERTGFNIMDRTLVLDDLTIVIALISVFSAIIAIGSWLARKRGGTSRSTTVVSSCLVAGIAVAVGLGYLGMGLLETFYLPPSWLMFAAAGASMYALLALVLDRVSRYGWGGFAIGFSWVASVLLVTVGLEGDVIIDYELIGMIAVLLIIGLGVLSIILRITFHFHYDKEKFQSKARRPRRKNPVFSTFDKKMRNVVNHGAGMPLKTARYLVLGLIIGSLAFSATTTAIGAVSIRESRDRQIVSDMDGEGIIWVAHPNDRIDPQFVPTLDGTNINPVIELSGAGNEIEPLQLVLRGTGQSTQHVYSVKMSDMNNLDNGSAPDIPGWDTDVEGVDSPVNWLETVPELEDKWYDPLMPFMQKPISSELNSILWVLFNITASQPAGMYNGTLTLEISSYRFTSRYTTKEINITIRFRVYGFDLPQYPSVSSYFGHMTSEEQMQYLTDHKLMKDCWIAPEVLSWNGNGTVDLNFTPFNNSIVDGLNRSFTRFIMHYPGSDTARGGRWSANWNATEIDYWTQVQYVAGNYTLPGLNATVLDRLYTYGYDEVGNAVGTIPENEHSLEGAYKRYKFMKDNGIKIRIMQTIHKPETYAVNEADDISVAEILEVVDIWCIHPKAFAQDPAERPQFMADLHQYIEDNPVRNVTIWTYTTSGPRFPVPTLTLLGTGTTNRALFWECFIHDYKGYLVWSASFWIHQEGGFAYGGFGGGALIYPHEDGFVGTHRGEMMREGVEDYEYFNLLKIKANDTAGEQLLDRVNQLYPSYGNLSFDNEAFSVLRHEIGLYIESHP
ncbi:MAG: glycoside hydrolase domain-containing protein [Candidatus Hodarchaeota archaeon]